MDTYTGLLYMGNGQYYDPTTGRFLNRNAKPDQTNPYVPWGGNPSAAFMAPLALLSLLYGRRKKRGKVDTYIILLVLGVALGLGLSACGSTSGPTITTVNTPIGPATITATPTPTGATVTITTPPPAGSPVGTPSATCTITLTPTADTLYNQAVQLLGFAPDHLAEWSSAEFEELLNWLKHGILFEKSDTANNRWTADNLKEVIEALDYASEYLGSKFDQALGLQSGGYLAIYHESTGTRTDTGAEGGLSTQGEHKIQLWLLPDYNSFATFTTLHEFGHFVSYYLGKLSYSQTWLDAAGWVQNAQGDWTLLDNKEAQKTVRGYSGTNPAEDFADTFAWMVEDKAGDRAYVESTFHIPSTDRQTYFTDHIAG
jgi:hypothetical protein